MTTFVLRLALAALLAVNAVSISAQNPIDLWVLPFNSNRAAEMVLAQTMQGLTGRDLPKLWLDRNNSMSAVILADLVRQGVTIHQVSSVWDLPEQFWQPPISGYILYQLGQPSLNVATSLAAPLNALAVDASIASQAEAKGLERVYDATGQTEQDIFDPNLFTRSMAVEQTPDKPSHLRDFGVLNNAFIFWAGSNRDFRRYVAETVGPGATIFGWGPNEFQWIADFSASSGGGVAADFCVNLSAMSKLNAEIPTRPIRPPPDPVKEGQRIIAFVLSDGDNVQWQTGGMPLDARWFASPLRGQFNMNWEVSPLLAGVAPRVLKYFYDHATNNDSFVAAGSPSYRYIHLEPDPKGVVDAQQSEPYLQSSHLHLVSVINDNSGTLDETIPLLELPEVDGVIYKRYSPYEGLRGQMLWHQGKPAVSYKFVLWENHSGGSPQQVASAIAAMPSSPATDPGSYALINVHAWSWYSIGGPIAAVKQTIDLLPPNTRVLVVEDFFSLLRNTFGN